MNLIRRVKCLNFCLLRRSCEICLIWMNLQETKGFNLHVSCVFSAAKLRFMLNFVLTTAQLMRKAAVTDIVELLCNNETRQCKSFPTYYSNVQPCPIQIPLNALTCLEYCFRGSGNQAWIDFEITLRRRESSTVSVLSQVNYSYMHIGHTPIYLYVMTLFMNILLIGL